MIKVMEDLATALASVDIVVSLEVLEARRQAISDAESTVAKASLATVAFQLEDTKAFEEVESIIAKHDATFARGRGVQIVALVSAIALESQIDEGEIDSALLALTARFMGGTVVRQETVSKALAVAHDNAKRSRERPSTKLAPNSVKTLLHQTGDLETPALTAGVRALSRRLEDVVKVFDERILLMDEEIDVLWWARDQSRAWSELDGMERVVVACSDLAGLIHRGPVTAVTREILVEELASNLGDSVKLAELSQLPASALVQLPPPDNGTSTPLLQIFSVAKEFERTPEVANALLEKSGIDLSREVSIPELIDQLLREFAYLQVSQ
jgi:hypothetical protein